MGNLTFFLSSFHVVSVFAYGTFSTQDSVEKRIKALCSLSGIANDCSWKDWKANWQHIYSYLLLGEYI